MLSIFVIGYDVIFIPLEFVGLVLGSELQSIVAFMDWTTAVFWTFDIFMAFSTGFHSEGIVELRPWRIAAAYMRSWFFC